MRKFLMLILCLFLASTLVASVSCEKKEVVPSEEAPSTPEDVLGEGFVPEPTPEGVQSEGMAPPEEEHHENN